MDTGILQKMVLVGYQDKDFTIPTGDVYQVLINPESYSLSYGNTLNPKSAQAASEEITTFNKRAPQNISFKFLFDGTGVIPDPAGIRDVTADIASFKAVVYGYDSESHQPPFVQLRWGVLLYNCQLVRMTIQFKLFRPDGTPLRAEADCTFNGVVAEEKLALFQDPESPDLTKVHIVADGESLSTLCYQQYGDSKYYYQIAAYNRLTDFKQLVTGTQLLFPPID